MSNDHRNKHIDIDDGEGPVWGRLNKAIRSALPTPPKLEPALISLGKTNADFFGAFGGSMQEAVDNVIRTFNAQFEIDKLVLACLQQNPTNEHLIAFAVERGIVSRLTKKQLQLTSSDLQIGSSLERMVDPDRGFENPAEFVKRMQQVMNAVCQIHIEGTNGTGTLVSPNVVLTNHHVVRKVIKGSTAPNKIKIRFDYQTPADGGLPTPGKDYSVVSDDGWLVDHRPFDPQDDQVRPREETLGLERDTELLDYALLRIDGTPGNDKLGAKEVERGFLPIPDSGPPASVYAGGEGVFIFQHPKADGHVLPLRMDWEKPAEIALANGEVRFVYNVNTTPGSSGSPVLSQKLEFIGLHHSGGKDWPAESGFLYNQGIPIGRIRDLLKANGKWDVL